MSHEIVVGMLNPAMSAIFGACLFSLWYYHRHLTYIAIFVLSYVVRLLCFGILYIAFALEDPVLRLLANAFILLATALLSVALSMRLGRRPHYGTLAAIGLIVLATLYVHQFVDPNLLVRAVVLNLGLAAVCLLMLVDIARLPERTPIEKLLFSLIAVACVGFPLRPLAFWIPGIPSDQFEGVYWIVVSISDALICSVLAVAIFAVIAVDVMDRIRLEAQIDVLSGLFNRRGFESRATDALARQDADAPIAMIVSDLDHFKEINDRFGHMKGDRVIQAFSGILKDKAPPDAIVARLGGEEFAVVLPQGQVAAAHLLAESVRSAFKELAPNIGLDEVRLTASFGIVVARNAEDLPSLMDRADHALYQAKRDGRDCIRQIV